MLDIPHDTGQFFYEIDSFVRTHLARGAVISERDYISRLCTFLNYPTGIVDIPFFKFSELNWYTTSLSNNAEQKFGCDCVFLFWTKTEAKLLFIEAKWPRVIKHNWKHKWDSVKTYKRGGQSISRFTSQLERQSKWRSTGAAFIELFMVEALQGKADYFLDSNGSTCVTFDIANNYRTTYLTLDDEWNNDNLREIITLERIKTHLGQVPITNLYQAVHELLLCNFGKAFNIDKDRLILASAEILKEETETVFVPIPELVNQGYEAEATAVNFMLENGLRDFISIQVPTLG